LSRRSRTSESIGRMPRLFAHGDPSRLCIASARQTQGFSRNIPFLILSDNLEEPWRPKSYLITRVGASFPCCTWTSVSSGNSPHRLIRCIVEVSCRRDDNVQEEGKHGTAQRISDKIDSGPPHKLELVPTRELWAVWAVTLTPCAWRNRKPDRLMGPNGE
jgi:hypothetical protein